MYCWTTSNFTCSFIIEVYGNNLYNFMVTHRPYMYLNTVELSCLFSFLRNSRSGIILINVCIAMIGLNITVVMVSLSDWSDMLVTCISLSCCWHYMMCVCLMWMLLESTNIYQSLVTVFISYDSHFILKRALIAWGMSFLNS